MFVLGNPELAMPDNVVYNAKRDFWVFHEDAGGVDLGNNDDIWACSQDGADQARRSNILTVQRLTVTT